MKRDRSMTRMSKDRRQSGAFAETAGATLIELLGYFFVLAIIINLAAGVFVQSSRLSTLGVQTLESMRALQSVQNAFTRSVRTSGGIAEEAGRFRSGPSTLVLRMPGNGSNTSGREFVVFGALGGERIQRWHVRMVNDVEYVEGIVTYPLDATNVRFVYDSPYPELARIITMQVEPKREAIKKYEPAINTISAAVRVQGRTLL